MITIRIESDLKSLDRLKSKVKWTPSSSQIRPSLSVKIRKAQILSNIKNTFVSPLDYLLSSVFSASTKETTNGLLTTDIDTCGTTCVLRPNEFPYDVDEGTHHSICWYPYKMRRTTDAQITKDIQRCLSTKLGHNNFEAVWYLNPKMTIPELFHVQVFWHTATTPTLSLISATNNNTSTIIKSTADTTNSTTTSNNQFQPTDWIKTSNELTSRVNSMQDRLQKKRRKRVRPRIANAYVEACALFTSSTPDISNIINSNTTTSHSFDTKLDTTTTTTKSDDTTTTTPTITTATVSTETYGELHTDSVYTLLETCTSINNTKGSDLSFLDLGSGHGKVVLLSSLFCGKSNGIESVQCRHKVAIQISQEFIQHVHPLMPSDQSLCIPTFSCGDMFEMSWSDHTIIYACSTCFDTNMMVEIAKKSAMELDNNAILCTVTHCLPANVIASTRLIEIKTITLQFTWGEEIVYMYQQQEQQQEQDQEQDQEQHKQHKKHEKHEEKESKESKEQKTSTDKLVMSEADKYNKAGSLLQNLGVYEKAIQQYRSALKKDKFHASSHFNMATCLCHLADKSEGSNIAIAFRRKARSHYIKASESSSNGFGEAHSNLAVLYLKENMLDEALASVEVALNLHDIGTMSYNKAFWNLSSVLRRLGQKDIAIERAWTTIEAASVILSSSTTDSIKEHNDATNNRFVRPTRIQCIDYTTSLSATSSTSTSPASKTSSSTIPPTTTTLSKNITLSIICVKWGTKYGPEYVLRLYAGVLRNLSLPFKFVCFTDDTVGLEHENNIHCLPLESGWIGWWNKATLFSSSFPLDGRILYIDLDTVITGSMNEMAMYRGDFAILSTNGIDNEGKDFSNGYNSSILMWNANNKKLTSICEVLRQDFELVHKFIHRFDHWLEMMVNKADLIQQIYPLSIRDYVNACTEFVPEKCSIVIFPLRPKPHEFPAEWVKEIWCQDEK